MNAWEYTKENYPVGTKLRGTVIRHKPYGVFVSIPNLDFEGLIQIPDFKDEGAMTMEEYPKIGSLIEAVILGFKDTGHQIWLGVKPTQMKDIKD